MNHAFQTGRAPDLRPFLDEWRYDPRNNVRLACAADGREMIVVRRPMGLEAYEVDGRPDGQRPQGMESSLDVQRARLAVATTLNREATFKLSAADCEDLFQEQTIYSQRLIYLFNLKEGARAVRDAARTLLLMSFVERYAEREEDRVRIERWRPTVLRLAAEALSMTVVERGSAREAPDADCYASSNLQAFASDLNNCRESFEMVWPRTSAPPAASGASPLVGESAFVRTGDYWTVRFQGQTANLRATRGLLCLRVLLRRPHQEVHVSELLAPASDRSTPLSVAGLQQPGGESSGRLTEAGPILDPQAKAEYKRRISELKEDRAEAERFNDPERAARAQEEIHTLARHLAAAVGLGGRDRRASSDAERARSTITKRIKEAIRRIADAVPPLGYHLVASIKTGYFCSYKPASDRPIHWQL